MILWLATANENHWEREGTQMHGVLHSVADQDQQPMVPDSSQDCPPACYVIEPGESPETFLKRMRQRLHIRGRNEDPYSAPRYQTKVAAERFDDRAH